MRNNWATASFPAANTVKPQSLATKALPYPLPSPVLSLIPLTLPLMMLLQHLPSSLPQSANTETTFCVNRFGDGRAANCSVAAIPAVCLTHVPSAAVRCASEELVSVWLCLSPCCVGVFSNLPRCIRVYIFNFSYEKQNPCTNHNNFASKNQLMNQQRRRICGF